MLSVRPSSIEQVDPKFLAEIQDLFAMRKFAHVGHWRYSEPMFLGDKVNGIDIWNRISERAKHGGNYYIFSDEIAIIRNNIDDIASHVPENAILIDLGPGSKEAILDKIGIILEKSGDKIAEYVAVDLVPGILKNAETTFSSKFAGIRFTAVHGDIFGALQLPEHGTRFAAIFGQTMFNIAIDPRDGDLAQRKILDMLTALRGHLRPGDKIVIPQNCSEDPEEIKAAYREQEEVWLNLFHRVRRDLPVEGNYDPDAFAFEPYWIPSSRILSHTAVPQKVMNFKLGAETHSLGLSDRLFMHNTVICPVSVFQKLYEDAGLHCYYHCSNSKGRMALHILGP